MKTIWLLLAFVVTAETAERPKAPPPPKPDDRYKADILLIIAHPDDDTAVAGYLARAIYEEHRRVAVICATRGDKGGNKVGSAQGAALGAEREIEGRQALASFGVKNVWFLGAPDTPSQDVLRSLEYWDHGSVLGQVVRLVRLTRPEVILTWLPAYVAGENHADHQGSTVIANEAFDLAGDRTAFAEQLATTEGLHSWQPKKIYYFSDAFEASGYWLGNLPVTPSPFRKNFLDGMGPAYSATVVSPSRQVSYARLAAEETSFYLTQDGRFGKEALETGNFTNFESPVRLIFGKSLVGGSVTGDVFEGVVPGTVPFVRVPGSQSQVREGLSLEFGGPWAFYREFWKAHQIEHLARLLPIPEVAIDPSSLLHIPLVIRNDTGNSEEVNLMPELPKGWTDQTRHTVYPLMPGDVYPVQAILLSPGTQKPEWQEITWKAEAGRRPIGSVTLRVYLGEGGMPQ
jgi:LmbE family N-acetylglucosaminyl deacetylase